MAIKAVFKPDRIQVNKFQLIVPGLPAFTPVQVSGHDSELDKAELPDRTMHSGGRKKGGEFELILPAHHTVEIVAMEAWLEENVDPISATAKKLATLTAFSGTGATIRAWSYQGVWPQKAATPDFELDNDGDMATITYTMSFDERNFLL